MIVNKVATAGGVTANTTSQTLLAANDRRRWAIICNTGAEDLWIGLGATAVVGQGICVAPDDSFVMDGDNIWRGSVTGILAANTSVIGTMELK
jgi:hypothetical protein